MSISVKCPGCQKVLRVADAKRGKRVKCPICSEAISVPDEDDDADFASEVAAPISSKKRPKKKGKKASGSNGLPMLIGIGVAAVVAIGIGIVLMRAPIRSGPVDQPSGIDSQSVATNLPSSSNSVLSNPSISHSVADNSSQPASEIPLDSPKTRDRDDDEVKPTPERMSASDEFFTKGMIPDLRIEISDAEMETLKAGPRSFVIGSPRPYVKGTIHEDGKTVYEDVAIKLKGSAGSFRPVDDRPALSINVSKHVKEQTFHGMSKFHLNNSVQDDTYLNEWLCEELFRAAKLPATRVTHARVWLNGRDLGLYVVKSAFDKAFLKRHFANSKGNLYEGGFVQDVDVELEKDSGKGSDDRSDLTTLLKACREPNPETRWERIDEILNVDQFISFMAMEMMVGHWDGYTLNHNNYRLYFDPKSGKANFLPHGMDQVFGNAGASIIDFPSSIVSSSVMLNGEWRSRYRERVGELMSIFSPTDDLLKRIDGANDRLRQALTKISPQATQAHDDRVKGLKDRITARVANLISQQTLPDPKPREFDESGRLKLNDWYKVSESPDASLEVVELPKGIKAYSILCGNKGKCNASWRTKVLLAKGKYILHSSIKANRINAPDEKNIAVGAGIRIAGMDRTNVRKGTINWTPLDVEFTVMEDLRMIELIAELRARKGQVWFEVDSFALSKIAI